jgi:hypothetical protein
VNDGHGEKGELSMVVPFMNVRQGCGSLRSDRDVIADLLQCRVLSGVCVAEEGAAPEEWMEGWA